MRASSVQRYIPGTHSEGADRREKMMAVTRTSLSLTAQGRAALGRPPDPDGKPDLHRNNAEPAAPMQSRDLWYQDSSSDAASRDGLSAMGAQLLSMTMPSLDSTNSH